MEEILLPDVCEFPIACQGIVTSPKEMANPFVGGILDKIVCVAAGTMSCTGAGL